MCKSGDGYSNISSYYWLVRLNLSRILSLFRRFVGDMATEKKMAGAAYFRQDQISIKRLDAYPFCD